MRLIHITEKINEWSGGPAHFIVQLAGMTVRREGVECEIVSFALPRLGPVLSVDPKVHVQLFTPPRLYLYGFSLKFIPYLHQAARQPETIFHVHNLWRFPLTAASWIAARHHRPVMISPHGALNPPSFSLGKWKKRLPWVLLEKGRLQKAAVLHATSEPEAKNLAALFPRANIAVIPASINIPPLPPPSPHKEGRTALFLSRLVPYKGVINLIEAWAQLRPDGWKLIIAGPDEDNHRRECEALVAARQLNSTVHFLGPLYGEAKWRAYVNADLFILPTFTENFGIVVLEALAAGVPVITTKGAPWKDLEDYQAGWWIDIGVEPLVQTLRHVFTLSPAELKERGARGRRLAEEKYSWTRLVNDFVSVYKWMLGGGEPPACFYQLSSRER